MPDERDKLVDKYGDKYTKNGRGPAVLERPPKTDSMKSDGAKSDLRVAQAKPTKRPTQPSFTAQLAKRARGLLENVQLRLPSLSLPSLPVLHLPKGLKSPRLRKKMTTLRPYLTGLACGLLLGAFAAVVVYGATLPKTHSSPQGTPASSTTTAGATTLRSQGSGGSAQTPVQAALAILQAHSTAHGIFTASVSPDGTLTIQELTRTRLPRPQLRRELLALFRGLSGWNPTPDITGVRIVLTEPSPTGVPHPYASASLDTDTLSSIDWSQVDANEAWQIYNP